MNGFTDVPEQQAGRSTDGKAEPSHVVIQIDTDPKPGHPEDATTREKWLDRLKKQREELPKPMQGKIHRVPDLLRANLKACYNYYQPEVVSLGPYHYGDPRLKKFQDLKRSIAVKLVHDKDLEDYLRSEITKNIESLMDAYSSEKVNALGSEGSNWEEMLFLDGCFVLYFIFCITYNRVEELKIEGYDLNSVHIDLFLVENQLPFELLRILSGNDPKLLDLVDDYICTHKISNGIEWDWRPDEPVHLLDRLRSIIIGAGSYTSKWQHAIFGQWPWQSATTFSQIDTSKRQPTILGPCQRQSVERRSIVLRHAKELTARGIHLKPNRTGFLKDIFFRCHFIYGTLKLPRIIVDHSTRPLLLNLAAYEMCAEVGSTITSYICFLDSLINHAEDIKELQSAGVLINHLATEEMAANLFNEMSQGLHPDEDAYMDVKKKIQKFFEHKTKASIASWVAEGYHNHFKSPLTAMAVLAAFMALALAATQTYFTIYQSGKI